MSGPTRWVRWCSDDLEASAAHRLGEELAALGYDVRVASEPPDEVDGRPMASVWIRSTDEGDMVDGSPWTVDDGPAPMPGRFLPGHAPGQPGYLR